MTKPILIESAKDANKLGETYTKVKQLSNGYGFKAVAALKEDQVKKAMTLNKKPADFFVEIEPLKNSFMLQLVCDVAKGKMRSVIGRAEIKTEKEFNEAKALAKVQNWSFSKAV